MHPPSRLLGGFFVLLNLLIRLLTSSVTRVLGLLLLTLSLPNRLGAALLASSGSSMLLLLPSGRAHA